jgi:hypothetical protein
MSVGTAKVQWKSLSQYRKVTDLYNNEPLTPNQYQPLSSAKDHYVQNSEESVNENLSYHTETIVHRRMTTMP